LRGPKEATPVNKSKIVEEHGHIQTVFAERSFGFIKNDVTGEVLHFFLDAVGDGNLLAELEDGISGQKVNFVVTPGPKHGGANPDISHS
jgi:cold shock CspA family protein